MLGSCVRVTAVMWRCRACVTAVLAVRPVGGTALPSYAAVAVAVARRHESAIAPTGGAAQLVAPQCARGCAAAGSALMQSTMLRPR